MEYLLLRQHVSALALGHHQVSNCVLTIINVTLSTRSLWMIWAIYILHCIVSSETQFETWWWPSARAETCFLSNKFSTNLLFVFWLYYLHHLMVCDCLVNASSFLLSLWYRVSSFWFNLISIDLYICCHTPLHWLILNEAYTFAYLGFDFYSKKN